MRAFRLALVLLIGACALDARAASVGFLGGAEAGRFAALLESAWPGEVRAVVGVDAVAKAKPPILLLIVDAAFGPGPQHEAAMRHIARAKPAKFAVVLTDVKKIHDPEILELIVGEIATKLHEAGVPGRPFVFLDSATVRVPPTLDARKGLPALRAYLR